MPTTGSSAGARMLSQRERLAGEGGGRDAAEAPAAAVADLTSGAGQ
jgi:hypothetical protein